MADHYNKQGRETIPGMLEFSYEELKEDLQEYGIIEDISLDDEQYRGTDLLVDIEFMGYHENPLKGNLSLLIYPEDSYTTETLKANRVKRTDVEALLEGRDIRERSEESLTPSIASKTEEPRAAAD